jgi:formylglycine-generating enzyme required for sulfatase activity
MSAAMPDGEVGAAAAPQQRSLVRFYVAVGAGLALVAFGAWFWTRWTNWQFDEYEARRRQAAAAAQLGLPVGKTIDLGDGVKLELVLVPAGMFDMGSPADEPGGQPDEGPQHRVRIGRPFYMGRYEVTQEQWEKAMGANPSHFKGAKLPVENVSWDDCQEFLKKLNTLVSRPGSLPVGERAGVIVRLPTEAEWEWACRAGTRTRFCCGDDEARLGEYAWCAANEGGTTHPVGGKQPNAWGLYDCHGNVWEWCSDWYGPYERKLKGFGWATNPQGLASGSSRVLRGGAWDFIPWGLRSANRDRSEPADRYGNLGLRVVVVVAALP